MTTPRSGPPTSFSPVARMLTDLSTPAPSILRDADTLCLLAFLRREQTEEAFRGALTAHYGAAMVRLRRVQETDICRVMLDTSARGPREPDRFARALMGFDRWDEFVVQIEVVLPVTPQPIAGQPWASDIAATARPKANSPVLLGVIDDGCPFAHWRFRRGQTTRVLAVWDQNKRPPVQVSGAAAQRFGRVPFDFQVGLEFWRDQSTSGAVTVLGLNDWLTRHHHAGALDEDGCYAEGGFTQRVVTADVPPGLTRLAGSWAHGSHVMDLMAGQVPLSSRVAPADQAPPTWANATDAASQADIVFVQIPEAGVRDATGSWLEDSILEGIEYIVSCADPAITPRVVITISYGPTTGPHDGSSALEQGLRQLCDQHDGSVGKVRLEIVLAAGNSWLTQHHVSWVSTGAARSWHWKVPPDNPVDIFAEVWIPAPKPGVTVSLTPPAGAGSAQGTVTPNPTGNGWTLRIPPTRATLGNPQPQPHGAWTVTVSGVPADTPVHAYLARTDPNFGARSGAKASHFIDPDWERTRGAAAAHRYRDGAFDDTGSVVSRRGTLSGMATDAHPQIRVAGGWVLGNGGKASYSSEGPARATPATPYPPPPRPGPDYALPTDETRILTGVPGAGTRAGASFRLVGTSSAAPQLARHLANGALPPVLMYPVPRPPSGHGNGNLPPP
jgi:hypothetical protein